MFTIYIYIYTLTDIQERQLADERLTSLSQIQHESALTKQSLTDCNATRIKLEKKSNLYQERYLNINEKYCMYI